MAALGNVARGADPPPLFGREVELSALVESIGRSAETARLVVVEGEAGIGKTRLVDEALGRVPQRFRVLRAAAQQLARERPFGLVCDALGVSASAPRPRLRSIAAMLAHDPGPPGADPNAGPNVRFQVVDAVLDHIEHLAMAEPVLLVLEDVHCADPPSVVVIDQIVQRLSDRPVGVVATMRPTPRSVDVEHVAGAGRAGSRQRIALGPLADNAVRDMVAAAVGARPGPELLVHVAGAAGNPFFVCELLSDLIEDDAVLISDGVAGLAARARIPTLQFAILRRMGLLPARSIEVLRVASVLGSRFRVDDLSVVTGQPASELLGVLDEPLRAGVLVDEDTALRFRHDLVRDAIYLDLPAPVRRALHGQVGRALADAGRPLLDVTTHILAGADPGDAEVVGTLRKAAAKAGATAPAITAELLSAAVSLVGDHTDLQDELLVELAYAYRCFGRLGEGTAVLDGLLRRPHAPAVHAHATLVLAQILIMQGRAAEAVARCEDFDRSPEVRDLDRARGLFDAATARLLCGDIAGAGADAERALRLGRALGDDAAVCGGLCATAWVTALAGRTQDALALGEQAVALAESSSSREAWRCYPHCFLGTVLMAADRLDEGRRMFDTGRRVAEDFGDAWILPVHHFGAVLADFYRGEYDDAETELAAATSIAEDVEVRTLAVWGDAVALRIALHRDELPRAEALLADGERVVEESGPGMGFDWLLWGKALVQEATGDTAGAFATLQTAWQLAESLGILAQRRLIGPDLVRLALAAGDDAMASVVATAMADAAERGDVGSARAAAARCRGMVDGEPRHLLAAVAEYRAGPRRMDFAATCEDAAVVLAGRGRESQARSLLGEAAEVYQRCGAVRDQRRADAALRALGVSRGARGPRRRPASGWASLTDTEQVVTNLAAEGLTNPEIGRRLYVSRRTVETHLSHVFAKLGVSSRVELAARVARRSG